MASSDFIADFFSYATASEDERSPEIFRIWSAISMVSAALERRVMVRTGRWTTYCNLYTLLVAPPGTGKSVITGVERLMRKVCLPDSKVKSFSFAPTSTTKASIVDTLEKAVKARMLRSGQSFSSSCLYFCAEDFTAFMPRLDNEYIGMLIIMYNCPDWYEERRRVGDRHTLIENPQFNFLAGIQPAIMGSLFPEELWTSGLARRLIMIFSDETRVIDPFADYQRTTVTEASLLARLSALSDMQGEITWAAPAKEAYREWLMGGEKPRPTHSKLTGYVRERARNMSKLAGISLVSRTGGITEPIQMIDYQRALDWMLEAEKKMPSIFRSMLGKSDSGLVEELWIFVTRRYIETSGSGVTEDEIWTFVGDRVSQERIQGIIDLAMKMNKIRKKDLNGKWEPTGKMEHKPE